LERVDDARGDRVVDYFVEVQLGAVGLDRYEQDVGAQPDGHRGAGQDRVRFRRVERAGDGGGPVARAWHGRRRAQAGRHVRVVFLQDGDDAPWAAVGLLGGDEAVRVGVLLDEQPLVQGVDGQVYLAEDQQEVAACHVAGRRGGDHDVR